VLGHQSLFGALFIPTILIGILPQSAQRTVGPYLPMNAGDAIYSLHRDIGRFGAWTGLGVFCLYAAAALGLGFILIARRDA
jgi:ABC-2 type transport system permease protein